MAGIYSKLATIQQEIKVNKGIWNKFGEFYYRSCENILEALKPYLKEVGCVILLDDEVVQIDDRIYIKATAKLVDTETNEAAMTHAYAREPKEKPKMDVSQVSGSASSYARKYALSGLLALDDAKDPDTNEYAVINSDRVKPVKEAKSNEMDEKCAELKAHVDELAKAKKITKKKALDICRKHGAGSFTSLTSVEQFDEIMNDIDVEANAEN